MSVHLRSGLNPLSRRLPIRTDRWFELRTALVSVGIAGSAMLFIVGIATLILLAGAAHGREQFPGQFAQVDPKTRYWFRNQLSPKTGGNCCSEADGVYVEEDTRKGADGSIHFWARWDLSVTESPQTKGWIEVPDDVVIKDPNRNGAPVVWWYFEQVGSDATPQLKVRCYAPGGGV